MHPRRILVLACLPALLLATACSSEDDKKKPDDGDTARIVKFDAEPATVRVGESTTLSWVTEAVSTIRIEDGGGAVVDLKGASPAAGSIEVLPVAGEGAKFTLFATSESSGAELRRTIDIQIAAPGSPRIDSFTAEPAKVARGEKATLKWATTDAVFVEIKTSSGVEIFSSDELLDGEHEVEPNENTQYVLTARGEGEPATRSLVVEVEGDAVKPTIASFTATPSRFDGTLDVPTDVTLAWTVTGATSLTIEPTPGETIVPIGKDLENDEIVVPVTGTTSFRLVATNDAGSVEMTALVMKVDPPTVLFHASSTQVNAGDEVTLVWNTTDAELVELLQDGEPISGVPDPLDPFGEVTVTVNEDSTFTLRAINEFDAKVEEVISVEVGEVGIESVIVTPERAAVGEDVVISWTAFGGSRIRVRDSGGAVVEGCEFTDRAAINAGSCTIEVDAEKTFTYDVELLLDAEVIDTESVDVVVKEGAVILEFEATPVVTVGWFTTVRWKTMGDVDGNPPVLTLEVDGTAVDVDDEDPLEGSLGITIIAAGTHTLKLTATAPRGEPAVEEVEVVAVGLPTVTLTATPEFWAPNSPDPVEVSWTSENAVELELFIVDDSGETSSFKTATASGTRQYSPVSIPVTYRMVATNLAGDVEVAEATVRAANPTITTFEVDEPSVGPREEVTLTWVTEGATGATLEPAHGGTLASFIDVSTSANIASFGADQCNNTDLQSSFQGGCYSHTFANGFTFRFDGSDRTEMWIYTSGAIGFGARGSGSGINAAMSATPGANSWVNLAPFWDAMARNDEYDTRSPSGTIHVGYGNDADRGDYVVVQWKNFWFRTGNDNDSPTSLNFEAVLFEDGSFDYRYGTMSSTNRNTDAQGAGATIGFQTGSGEFVNISHDAEFPGGLSNFGFTFRPAEVEANGSWTVVPLADTTYVLTASNAVGSEADTVDVTVSP